MAKRIYLAADLGAESGRLMAGSFDGSRIALEELHRFPNGPVHLGGTLRWNLVGLWQQIQHGLGLAGTKFGDQVASVGVDTWGVDFVLLNRNDELLGQPWNYRDRRTDGMMQKALQKVSREEIFAQTGLQFMEINSLFQMLAMCERDPELVAQAERFLMVPDFLHWCLCGSRVVEFTNATTTQMLNATTRTWATELLSKLQIPQQMFPEIVAPGTKLGRLRSEIAALSALKGVEVVAPATHDTGSAVAAVPTAFTGRPNWAYISSGTWSLMGLEVADAVLSEHALRRNVTNEGGLDGTYRLLKNIMGLWLVQQCRRAFARRGKDLSDLDYTELTRQAAAATPFRSLIDPDAEAFLRPLDMADAIAEECRRTGQPVPENEGQYIRCCLESLAFKYRMVLRWLEELTSIPVQVIHVVGGGGKNELLNQLTADACGIPVHAGPVEATALGNVLVQAMATGDVGGLSEIREIVRRSETISEFEPQNTAQWDEQWQRFQSLCSR